MRTRDVSPSVRRTYSSFAGLTPPRIRFTTKTLFFFESFHKRSSKMPFSGGVPCTFATYSFIIDREEPNVSLNGAESGETVNTDVSLTHTDKAELYKNGELVGEYVSDTPITEDGEYRIVISDLAGNVTEVTFAIDKTAPMLTFDGVDNGGTTKGSVTVSETEKKAMVKVFLDGEEIKYSVGDELRDAGTYKVVTSDEYGNTNEYTFTIEQGSNVGLWVLIGIAVLLSVGLAAFFVAQRKNKI